MRPDPAGVRFVVTAAVGGPTELWLVCGKADADSIPVQLSVDGTGVHGIAAAGDRVDAVIAGIQRVVEEHGLELLEDPRLQLAADGHQRSADPVVQRAVAAAHAAGEGTYRQLADQFGLAHADEVSTVIEAGAALLASEREDAGEPGATVSPRPDAPTEVQRAKFREFQNLPERDSALEVLSRYIRLAGFDVSDLGSTWGVTVCVDSDSLIRVNVGGRETLCVLPNGRVRIYGFGEPPDVSGIPGSELGPGFYKVDGTYDIVVPIHEARDREIAGLRPAVRAFVESQTRRMNPRFHNPLMTPIVRGLMNSST